MMYRIEIIPQAYEEIETIANWIAEDSETRANQLYHGIMGAIGSLSSLPERCAKAPEHLLFSADVRQLLYGRSRGKYRILFTITGKIVRVLHIVHSSKQHIEPTIH